jgi:hypothetical protein
MKDLRAGRAPDASAMLGAKPMPRNDGREMALRRYCLNEWLDATKPVQTQRWMRGGTAVFAVSRIEKAWEQHPRTDQDPWKPRQSLAGIS